MTDRFDKTEQLKMLLRDYPNNKDLVDIEGVILDYMGHTGSRLDQVLEINTEIYKNLFRKEEYKDAALNLLRSTVRSEKTFRELRDACEDMFVGIRQMLDELRTKTQSSMVNAKYEPDAACGFPVQSIIWQLSDIHFGEYNVLVDDPSEMAAIMGRAASEYNFKPHLILVSGDLTSRGTPEESAKFLTFCEKLSKHVWNEKRPSRFLVVPGNHETTWEAGGTADKLKAFRGIFTDQDVVLTPFGGLAKTSFEGGKVRAGWFGGDTGGDERTPPFALVEYDEYALEVLLLVSSYYSGFVPQEVREILDSSSVFTSKAALGKMTRLENLLRIDEGAISYQYIYEISKNLPKTPATRLGLIHHNMTPYGVTPCPNKLAPALLKMLYEKNTSLLFHGHVHLIEDPADQRPNIGNHTYCVPCTSLSSDCLKYNRGFSVHLVGKPDNVRKITSIVWQLAGTNFFEAGHFSLRYAFEISSSGTKVRHGTVVW